MEKEKSSIDLSAMDFNFCTDDQVKSHYDEKLHEIEDKDKWIKENREKLEQNKVKVLKAVEEGLITDGQLETIWRFQHNKAKEKQKKASQIKKELEGKVEDIKRIVAERLGGFLPNWTPNKVSIFFTVNEKADFCVNKNNITVDLGRLVFEKDLLEKTVQGITHEVFHIWMSEKSEWSDVKQNSVSDETLRDRIVFKTIDEGLAVLVSGQLLKTHHEKQGKEYNKYIQESFVAFNQFMSTTNRKELEKIKDKEFQDIGHFYVVGYEIVHAILKKEGIENFRKLIEEARSNAFKMLELYKIICTDNQKLLK